MTHGYHIVTPPIPDKPYGTDDDTFIEGCDDNVIPFPMDSTHIV